MVSVIALKNERGIKRCLEFITGGDGDPGSVRDQLRRLEARKREIDADLRSQQDGANVAIHPNLPELYRKKVVKLQLALQHEVTRPQVFETIRSLVDRIEVLPGRGAATARSQSLAHWPKSWLSPNKKRPPPVREAAVRP